MTALLDRIERYYDEVPRRSATTEEVGPFTVFVRAGEGWPFYARPRAGASGAVTADDVRRVRARQRELGVPEAFEWVDEVAPGVAEAAAGAGLRVARHPLMVLRRAAEPASDGRVRMLEPGDPDVGRVNATVGAAFAGADDVEVRPVAHLEPLLVDGSFRLAGAFDPDGSVLGGGSHAPRGEVTEVTGVGVLPRARRRGLGAALTAALVADAVDRGARTVFLSAGSPEVARLYGRLGFETVATACVAEPSA